MDNVNLVQVVFDRSAQAPNEDVAIWTMHIRGIVDNLPDSLGTINDGDRDAFSAALGTFWNAIKGDCHTLIKLTQARYYEMGDTPDEDMGPPVKISNFNLPGTSASFVLPPQMSMSVTLKHPSTGGVGRTGSRWGRFYIPGLAAAALDSVGRWDTAVTTRVANAAVLLYRPVGGVNGCKATTWSRRLWDHADPNVLQVDDVPDVIRSRRFSSTNSRIKVTI